jgi:hypothetical protein
VDRKCLCPDLCSHMIIKDAPEAQSSTRARRPVTHGSFRRRTASPDGTASGPCASGITVSFVISNDLPPWCANGAPSGYVRGGEAAGLCEACCSRYRRHVAFGVSAASSRSGDRWGGRVETLPAGEGHDLVQRSRATSLTGMCAVIAAWQERRVRRAEDGHVKHARTLISST